MHPKFEGWSGSAFAGAAGCGSAFADADGADAAAGSTAVSGGFTGGRVFGTLAATCNLPDASLSCLGTAGGLGERGAVETVEISPFAAMTSSLDAPGGVFGPLI